MSDRKKVIDQLTKAGLRDEIAILGERINRYRDLLRTCKDQLTIVQDDPISGSSIMALIYRIDRELAR